MTFDNTTPEQDRRLQLDIYDRAIWDVAEFLDRELTKAKQQLELYEHELAARRDNPA